MCICLADYKKKMIYEQCGVALTLGSGPCWWVIGRNVLTRCYHGGGGAGHLQCLLNQASQVGELAFHLLDAQALHIVNLRGDSARSRVMTKTPTDKHGTL